MSVKTAHSRPFLPTRQSLTPSSDSGRWSLYDPRPGDVLVCSPPKSGTTWLLSICAHLRHQSSGLPKPLSELSLWLDDRDLAASEVKDFLARDTGPRILKTHSPLDTIAWADEAIYLHICRDPRDVFFSRSNFYRQHASYANRPEVGGSVDRQFQDWLNDETGLNLPMITEQVRSFAEQPLPNVHFLHFNQLLDNPEKHIRRIAGWLGQELDATTLANVTQAVSFEAMRDRAGDYCPDPGAFEDPSSFFSRGVSGQWRDVLSQASLDAFDARLRQLLEPRLARWLVEGRS
jgi:aryl sulfotransferase